MKFLNTLFSTTGLLIAIYILIGIFYNTAPPPYSVDCSQFHIAS